jgi:hypothetical protein
MRDRACARQDVALRWPDVSTSGDEATTSTTTAIAIDTTQIAQGDVGTATAGAAVSLARDTDVIALCEVLKLRRPAQLYARDAAGNNNNNDDDDDDVGVAWRLLGGAIRQTRSVCCV